MRIGEWLKIYRRIAEDFGFDMKKDQVASYILSSLLDSDHLFELTAKIRRKPCLVFGAGPSLAKDFKKALRLGATEKTVTVCADDAVTVFKQHKTKCDVITTDLDGDLQNLKWMFQQGSLFVVHGHGDNIKKLKEIVPLLKSRVVGSTQVFETPRVHNFGGFTDGDRAVFLCTSLGASKVGLLGMDFRGEIGSYSIKDLDKVKDPSWEDKKRKKLKWAEELISILVKKERVPIYNLSKTCIKDVPNLGLRKFLGE